MRSRKPCFASTVMLILLSLFNFALYSNVPAQTGGAALRDLEQGFQNPPRDARPGAFWPWLQGNVSLPELKRELEEMKDKGMSGAEIWDVGAANNENSFIPTGPAFLSPASVDAMTYAIKEATRLGLRLGMVTSSGWNAGGAWVKPEDASKGLYISQVTVKGPMLFSEFLPFPKVSEKCPKGRDGLPRYYKDIAVLAFPKNDDKIIKDVSSIVNLTEVLEKSGRLSWYVPEGDWVILRMVCTNTGQMMIIPSPNSNGYFIDFLDPEATKMHMEYIIGKLLEKLGSFRGTAFGYLEVDSMELQEGNPWTGNFLHEFMNRRGYDATLYLPVLAGWTVKDNDTAARFTYDYKKTISDLLIFSHYTTGREVLEKYGLELVAEAGGPGPPVWNTCPVDALKALGQASIPRGEFWIHHRNIFLIKEISSAAHIYGKKYVDAESFTTWRRWMDSPFALKRIADRALCEGLNRLTFHTFSHTPPEFGLPGPAYHAGVDINTNATWWQKAKPFINYLARCCYMLQQGLFVGDVCYYYGDKAPNFYPSFHNVPEKMLGEGLGQGYDYDVVNTEVILNRMSVKDGRIVLPDGMSYQLLVLPAQNDMPLAVLQKMEQLVKDGATIIGQKPFRSNGLANQPQESAQVKDLADRLWGACDGKSVKENSYGQGKVLWGYTPREILQKRGIGPDFSYSNAVVDTALDYIHRKAGNEDIYFVRNTTDHWNEVSCLFRVSGRQPQLWSPETGEIDKNMAFESTDGGTKMNLRLPPGGSVFVLFGDPANENHVVAVEKTDSQIQVNGIPSAEILSQNQNEVTFRIWNSGMYKVIGTNSSTKTFVVDAVPLSREIGGSWGVTFPAGWGAPPKKVFPKLISWTDDEEEGVKYFSGTATYRTEIDISPELLSANNELFIDLGKVGEIADVSLNGKHLGILWKPPYRIEIAGAAQEGKNELTVEITNLWENRLAGDLLLPPNKKFCKTNQRPPTSDAGEGRMYKAVPSGLMGPVKLIAAKKVTVSMN